MSYTLTFSMTSVSGDDHDCEIIFNTREDAQKAKEHISATTPFRHHFSIQSYKPPPSMSFEEWRARFG